MNILIAKAYASTGPLTPPVPAAGGAVPAVSGAGEATMLNLMMILVMVGLFYLVMIVPQQKRFKKHREMLSQLKKGDRVLTAAGFIGTVDKVEDGQDEIVVDLGNGVKVTALRSTIHERQEKKDAKGDRK